VRLKPYPFWLARLALFSSASIGMGFMISSREAWCAASAAFAVLFGSFAQRQVAGVQFEQRWFFAFVPMLLRRVELTDVEQIETVVEDRGGLFEAFCLGLYPYTVAPFAESFLPWVGGPRRIALRMKSGRLVRAWTGLTERSYAANLQRLQQAAAPAPVKSVVAV
jgi:hypothetical protein